MNEISSLIDANGVRVAEFEIDPKEKGIFHYHSEIMEYCYCIKGQLSIDIENSEQSIVLLPGEKIEIPLGVVHRVNNDTNSIGRYLVVQGVGSYDFIQT